MVLAAGPRCSKTESKWKPKLRLLHQVLAKTAFGLQKVGVMLAGSFEATPLVILNKAPFDYLAGTGDMFFHLQLAR